MQKETEIRKGIALAEAYVLAFNEGRYQDARAILKKSSRGSIYAHETFTERVLRNFGKVRANERKP